MQVEEGLNGPREHNTEEKLGGGAGNLILLHKKEKVVQIVEGQLPPTTASARHRGALGFTEVMSTITKGS